jgi:bifunctional non-homologous end joining protein LigD
MKKTESKKRAAKTKFEFFEPQLAQLVSKPPTGEDWAHEIKLDGYRTIVRLQKKKAIFYTRSGLDWSEKYESLQSSLSTIAVQSAVLDGEICVTDESGITSFQALQAVLGEPEPRSLTFYIFDLLELNGEDLRDLPLQERKEHLHKLFRKSKAKNLVYSEHYVGDGALLLNECCEKGLEGIISKKLDAPYTSGRLETWVKAKCHLEQEFIIIGFSRSEKRSGFKSLLLGVYEGKGKNKKLRYVGRVGTGFNQEDISRLVKKFKSLLRNDSPLVEKIKLGNKWRAADEVQWLEPKYLAQIEFRGWTADKQLRQASFKGIREDKPAKEVGIEKPKKVRS